MPCQPPLPIDLRKKSFWPGWEPPEEEEKIPVGGRLTKFFHNWKKLTKNKWILDIIKDGVKIDLTQSPSGGFPRNWSFPEDKEDLEKEHQRMLKVEAVIKCSKKFQRGKTFYSQLFTIAKKDTKEERRPCFNLKKANQFVIQKHFKMEGINTVKDLLKPQDWMIKIDITKAYYHILIHPAFQNLLRYVWNGEHFKYQVLPFGLSTSPWIFTKVIKEPMKFLRGLGIRLVFYLDDILIIGSSPEEVLQHGQKVIQVLSSLGFLIHQEKSVFTPSQVIQFLGYQLDSTNMSILVPKEKLKNLKKEASHLINHPRMTIRKLASFLGKLNALSQAMPHQSLMTRQLLRIKNQALSSNGKNWEAMVDISPAKQELIWWIQQAKFWNGKPIHLQKPQMILTSDASKTGWGGTAGAKETRGFWSMEERSLSNNARELKAAALTIQALVPPDTQSVEIQTDNQVAMAYINNQGGKHPHLSAIAQDLWKWCMDHRIWIHATYLQGSLNKRADALSRKSWDKQDWMLHPSIFRRITQHWGVPWVDLFASRLNHQVSRYVSRFPDPGAWATDAFQITWPEELVFANPPFGLVGRVLKKQSQSPGEMILIAPLWRSAPWFPELLTRTSSPPILLPRIEELFLPVSKGHQLPVGNPLWRVAAWKISPASSGAKDSQRRSWKFFHTDGGTRLHLPMIQLGKNGKDGAKPITWIL